MVSLLFGSMSIVGVEKRKKRNKEVKQVCKSEPAFCGQKARENDKIYRPDRTVMVKR